MKSKSSYKNLSMLKTVQSLTQPLPCYPRRSLHVRRSGVAESIKFFAVKKDMK